MIRLSKILFQFTDNYRLVWFLDGWIYWGIMLVLLSMSIKVIQHIKYKHLKTAISIVLPIVATCYFKDASGQLGSYYAFAVISSIIIVATIKILDLILLERVDYAILYSVFLAYKSEEPFLEAYVSFTLIVLFSSLFILAALRRNIKENIFNVWGTFAISLSSYLVFLVSYEMAIYPGYNILRYYYPLSNLLKISFFGGLMIVVIILIRRQ